MTCRQFSGRPCANSGRPRHSLHGKPAVFTAATSRFTAIMSQLSYNTRGPTKKQEQFLYLYTNIFVKFHDSAISGGPASKQCYFTQFFGVVQALKASSGFAVANNGVRASACCPLQRPPPPPRAWTILSGGDIPLKQTLFTSGWINRIVSGRRRK